MPNTTDRQRVALETLNVCLYPMECRLHPIELAHHASRLAESADLERWVGGMACLLHDTAQWLALLSREPDADSGMAMSTGEAITTAHVHELGGYRPKVGKHRRKTVAESYVYMIHDWVRWGGIHDLTRIPSVDELEKALRLPRSTGAGTPPKGVQLAQDIIESLDGVHPSDINRDIEREGVQVAQMLAASKDEGSAGHGGPSRTPPSTLRSKEHPQDDRAIWMDPGTLATFFDRTVPAVSTLSRRAREGKIRGRQPGGANTTWQIDARDVAHKYPKERIKRLLDYIKEHDKSDRSSEDRL